MPTLTPAYGRDYKSKKEALEDFNNEKDFVYNSFNRQTYCTKKDLIEGGETSVQIRFKKLTQVIIVKLI